MDVVFQFLADRPIVLLFLLLGVGAALGTVRVAGVSLGAVGVLFAAIGITAWGVSTGVTIELPAAVGDLGLVVFAFCTGLIAGPGFFNALRTSYLLMLAVAGVLVVAGGLAFWVGSALGIPPLTIAGTFAGALTNTPALAATGGSPEATVGYASAYVYGVIAAMIGVALALRSRARDTDAQAPIVGKPIEVDTTSRPTAADIAAGYGGRVAFSRRRHADGEVEIVGPDTELEPGDIVNVVGPSDDVEAVKTELGHTSAIDLTRDRSRLDFRRIILSDVRLAGRSIASLRLPERYGATIAQVRRGDVDFVGSPDFVLHQGDRLRVVGPTGSMGEITRFLGDSERGLADINPVALGIGVLLGMLLGSIVVPLPGGGQFSLGYAAGVLVVGLIMGRIGRIGRVVTSLPNTASTVLAEFGLLTFLAFAGTKAGSLILSAIASGEVVRLLVLGAVLSTFFMGATFVLARAVFRLGGTRSSGVIGGAQTNPAILGFANSRTDYDVRVALGYTLVYPAAMVVKILIAQVLVEL
ncbi:aspartate:alanine exchanger family transporter [Microbacterium atlanticum]|uniref:aspartate:alanine exchanger family transporter n=1 Tax=Microbacterium atlanticum TaxID=2782168 RepID=UPI001887F0DE|nr:TrkA C-terminal domain-containing protein [Microbacterium atlanticum]